MLLITKRRKIGVICGHAIYAITKSEILPIPNSSVQPSVAYSKNENRSFVNSACKCKTVVDTSIGCNYAKHLQVNLLFIHMYLHR